MLGFVFILHRELAQGHLARIIFIFPKCKIDVFQISHNSHILKVDPATCESSVSFHSNAYYNFFYNRMHIHLYNCEYFHFTTIIIWYNIQELFF